MIVPCRSKVRKSFVVSRDVVIPSRLAPTYVMWNTSPILVTLGSSTPYSSSAAADTIVGSSSIVKRSPSVLRATRRCEMCAR